MRDVIYVKLDIVYSINHQLNGTISRKTLFFETVESKVIISLFETVKLLVSISPRNLYNSLKSIKEKQFNSAAAKRLNIQATKIVRPCNWICILCSDQQNLYVYLK